MIKRKYIPAPIERQCYEEVFYICPLCLGKTESLGLQIHHIDGDKNNNNNKNNLIALCVACHGQVTGRNIKKSELEEIKKDLRFRDTPIDAFNIILDQPAHRIHDRFAAEGPGAWSHLLQGIKLFELFLRRTNLSDYQIAEVLLKLIQLERRYGAKLLKHAEQHLKELKQLAQARPHFYGKILYEDGYIKYLKNDLQGGISLLQASEQITHDKFTKANIRIIQHGMRLNLLRSNFNENDYYRDVNLLQDWDATWHQNSLQHLIAKYLLDNNLDMAEELINQYEKINREDSRIRFEENNVPSYYRGRIYLLKGDIAKAIEMFLLTIKTRLLTALELHDNINIAGLSYGGWITAQYALKYPDRLNKVVLLAPVGTVMQLSPGWIIRAIPVAIPARYFTEKFMYWLAEDTVKSGIEGRALIEEHIDEAFLAVCSFKTKKMVNPTVLTDDELKQLTIPILFMIGENEKIYSSREALKRLHEVAPQIQTQLIQNAGHDLTMVQAEFVNEKMLEFLKQP